MLEIMYCSWCFRHEHWLRKRCRLRLVVCRAVTVFGDSERIQGREERRGGSDIIDLCPVIRNVSTAFVAPYYNDPPEAQYSLHLRIKHNKSYLQINATIKSTLLWIRLFFILILKYWYNVKHPGELIRSCFTVFGNLLHEFPHNFFCK